MKMKRTLLLCLTLIVCAALTIGSTLAYLTDTDSQVNVFTMGNVDISLQEAFDAETAKLYPDVTIEKKVWIANEGKTNAYVWYTFAVPAAMDNALALEYAFNKGEGGDKWITADYAPVVRNYVDPLTGELCNVYTVLYNDILLSEAVTPYSLESVTLSAHVDYHNNQFGVVKNGVFEPIDWTPIDNKLNITVSAYAIQQNGFETLKDAYDAYQGQWGELSGKTVATANDTESLIEALEEGANYIKLEAGTYTFPSSKLTSDDVIVCDEGTVFEGNSKLNIKGATVVGATFSNPAGDAVGQTINGIFKDCTFTGSNGLRWCYAGETVVFENCVFDGDVYGAHFDGGANEVIFKYCTFSGFNAMGDAITMATYEGCTFKANDRSNYNGINLWGSTKMTDCTFIFDGSVANEWVDARGDNKTYTFNNCFVNDGTTSRLLVTDDIGDSGKGNTVTVDGVAKTVAP